MKYIGLISSDARGKNGGNVASRNRYGTYLRRHVAGVQPRSTSQQANRNAFGAISSAWRGQTVAEIAGWNSLASTVTLKDSLGQSYNPTGAQLFMLCSRNLILTGGSANASAPATIPSIPALDALGIEFAYGYNTVGVTLVDGGTGYPTTGTFTVTWSTGTTAGGTYAASGGIITSLTLTSHGAGQTGTAVVTFSGAGTGASATATLGTAVIPEVNLTFAPTPVPEGSTLLVYLTKAISVGRTFSGKSNFRFIDYAEGGDGSALNLASTYEKVFGQAPTHGQMLARAHLIDAATGYPGPAIQANVSW